MKNEAAKQKEKKDIGQKESEGGRKMEGKRRRRDQETEKQRNKGTGREGQRRVKIQLDCRITMDQLLSSPCLESFSSI